MTIGIIQIPDQEAFRRRGTIRWRSEIKKLKPVNERYSKLFDGR